MNERTFNMAKRTLANYCPHFYALEKDFPSFPIISTTNIPYLVWLCLRGVGASMQVSFMEVVSLGVRPIG